ncbi:MAG: YlxR family protein [Clostridia bacterium]|nr:YlxR family protein [Clostridia bacterium]
MKNTQQKQKKIPERRCTGCGESFPKRELIRVVRSPEGEVSIDFTGKKSGRGAYICPKSACFKKARKQGRIAKSLEVSISDELYDALEHEVAVSEAEAEMRID